MFVFPAVVLIIYGILYALMPEKALAALRSSGRIFLTIIFPLGLIFILMLVVNLFLKPRHIAGFLAKGAGIKGVLLSTTAGIISAGPIFVWYPLLKGLREKGAGNSLIAIFLNARAIKPFLLPVMISYFGWRYVIILTIFTVFGSIGVGYCVDALVKENQH